VTQQTENPSGMTRLRRYAYLNIGGKIVLPYLILTLVVAGIGIYVVLSLVVSSLDERLQNQLVEAGKVVSDTLVRHEVSHLESARAIAFTVGLAEALQAGDEGLVVSLAQPQAAVREVEYLIITDAQGNQVLHGIQQDDGSLEILEDSSVSELWMVQDLIKAGDPEGLPKRGLVLRLADRRYYYFTAIPVGLDDQFVGVVTVGTSVDTLLPQFKLTSLADVIIYSSDGQAIASTFALSQPDDAVEILKSLAITPEVYQDAVSSTEVVGGETIDVHGKQYRVARDPLQVGNDTVGAFAVALPTNFIVEQRAANRNVYLALFATVTVGVVVTGFLVSRLITNPLGRLVRTSQAVADGDLEQRTGIKQSDEIGILATTFDQMTGRLADRTRALEETLGRMEAILSSIGDGVLLEDLEHSLIPLNSTANLLLHELIEHSLVGELRALAAETLAEEDSPLDPWLIERRRFEVGKKVISAHSAAVRTDDGEHIGTVIVLRDVTAEAEADRLKDAFVAHVSHELRTPLTAIKGYSELMLVGATGSLEDEQRRFIQTIHHHTDSLVSMINTLLDFSEMEAWDRLTLARHPTQLPSLLEETIEPWYSQMEEKQLAFTVEVSDGLPEINVDARRLQWVIVNLVRNALQYTPEGGSVSVRLYEQDGNVVFDVTDTGIGISEKDQEELFTRFYRVERATEVRGIGLGLYVSKAIVESHGGEISVSSELGVGSTFSVVLPVLGE
jgi:two-component system, OmpR family, sensor histidine kinase VicK